MLVPDIPGLIAFQKKHQGDFAMISPKLAFSLLFSNSENVAATTSFHFGYLSP
jgi:hypothetical protein